MVYCLFVSDHRRLFVALQAAGLPVRRDRDGAIVIDAPLALVRDVARRSGVSIIQSWPPLPRLPDGGPPGQKLPNTPHRREQ